MSLSSSSKKANKNEAQESSKLKKFLKLSLNFMGELFFPEKIKCIFCDSDLVDFSAQPYCDKCAVPLNEGHRCAICDAPIANEAKICDFCQLHHRSFSKAFCPLLYDGVVQSKILSYKNQNCRYLATGFAILIAKRLREENVQVDIITYVPMTKEKEKLRTFNQSKLLAERLSELLHVPVKELFVKIKETSEQKSLSYKERQENAKKSFARSDTKPKPTDKILIVDDVLTTCATVDACAKLLKRNCVYVCGVARQYLHPEERPIVVNRMKTQQFSFKN